jgi:hypothetical protein
MSEPEPAGWEAFLDDSLELRRLFAEAWGTFLLVLVAAGAGVVSAVVPTNALALPVRVVAPGATVMTVIYFMGTISGAHLNPAVTWAFALRGNFPWRRVPGYLGAQTLGALTAAGFLALVFGSVQAGMTRPGLGISSWQALVTEFVLTLGLLSVILGTSSGAGVGHRVCPDSRAVECDPRHVVRSPQRRGERGHRGRGLYRDCGGVGGTCFRCIDESSPIAGPCGADGRAGRQLDLRAWARRRGRHRSGVRVRPQGPGHRRR